VSLFAGERDEATKLLAAIEVSQKVKKIMINLELFEDRKIAHKLQKEVGGKTVSQGQSPDTTTIL
jgi:hypothetical protein